VVPGFAEGFGSQEELGQHMHYDALEAQLIVSQLVVVISALHHVELEANAECSHLHSSAMAAVEEAIATPSVATVVNARLALATKSVVLKPHLFSRQM
jgi:hypothetical protein